MNNELIKRYVYAVISHLPAKTQAEVEKELESMISELLDARCGGAKPTDGDVKVVLTELGSPEELAAKYSGEENKSLISGIYLLWFKKTLKVVLPVASIIAVFAVLLSSFIKWQPPQEMYNFIPEMISEVISGAFSAAAQAFMWITLVFIVLERKKVKFSGEAFLSKLPPVPAKRAQIKLHKPVVNIFWHIAAAVLLLKFSDLIGGYSDGTGWIPTFDESYIHSLWYLVVLWAGFCIIREIAKLTGRRYSKRLAAVSVVTNVPAGISAALLFSNNLIVNPLFAEKSRNMLAGMFAEEFGKVLARANLLILAIVLFVLLMDTGVAVYRAFRYDT